MSNFKINHIVSFAQNREDVIIRGFLKNVEEGFYVDIGANHPVNDSVTNLFYKLGWCGINIEPIKALYKLLESSRPRDINLNIGVGSRDDTLRLRHYKNQTGLSTFSDELKEQYEATGVIEPNTTIDEDVQVRTLKSILSEYKPKDIHFMKIDVEGFEREVLKGNDWNIFRPWIICIEANNVINPWEDILEKNNYKQVFFDGLNKYFVASEHKDIAGSFSYPETILAKPVFTPDIEKAFQKVVKDKELGLVELEKLKVGCEQMNSQLYELQNEVAQAIRLKGSIKQLLRAIDTVISVRIDKLDRPNIRSADSSVSLTPKSANDLLRKIKLYDFDKYYSTRTGRLSYRITDKSYRFITRSPLRLLRKAKLMLKGAR